MDQMQQAPQAPQAPQSPHKKSDSTTLILIIVGMIVFGVVAVAIIGALVAYVLTQTVSTIVEEADIDGIVDVIEEEIEDELDEEIDNGETVIDETSGELVIQWIPFFEQSEQQAESAFSAFDYQDYSTGFYYEIGTVGRGAYTGYRLRAQVVNWNTMGGGTYYIYYLSDPNGISKPIILDRYGSLNDTYFGSGDANDNAYKSVRQSLGEQLIAHVGDRVVFNTKISIPEFSIDESIKDTAGRTYLFFGDSGIMAERPSDEVLHGTTTGGQTLYRSRSYADTFYYVREDGRVLTYSLEIPFWPSTDFVAKPTFSWPNGWPAGEYAKGKITGCGFQTPINVISDINTVGDLRAVTVSSGHTIYLPEDLTNSYFSERYKNWVFQGDASYEEYADIMPFFYWKDQIGRWLEFTHVDVLPAAECGKPVIYLYPEETMDVDVTVEPRGGFTFTEPAYNDGWSVTAKPNGQLRNKADGKTYPYLFWEGRGGLYQAPEEFWVVEQKEVKRFLKSTLAQYGLNRQEIADFNEFWVPRMKEAEYYKIGFHGTAVMDEIAPLTVSGGPDSIFRILMDFEELEEPVEANPPKNIVPFERVGFTVVEWGGVIE